MSVDKDKSSLSLPEKDLNTVDDCSLSEDIHRCHAVAVVWCICVFYFGILKFSALFCKGASS